MDWRVRLSDRPIRKLAVAELHIHCQWQKCSARNLVSGDISFMGLFAMSLGFSEERQIGELPVAVCIFTAHSLYTDVQKISIRISMLEVGKI